jgi:hypothetical protein
MQFYGISFMRPYKQSGRWHDVLDTGALNKYHKTACTSLPDDEHLDVRNRPKTIQVN